ncbi:GLPGLI family protein, partial [Flavobacteriaceae bacterium]|nr:GLPGLI family protein [Flavobacteriaceae bacterium]
YSVNYQGELIDAVKTAEGASKTDQIFYIDRKNNLFVNQFNYWLTDVLVEDAILKNNWELKNVTKVIGGYTCYKAVETKTVSYSNTPIETVAWYTLAINLPIGPLNYGGLPGLILRLDTDTHSYYATNIDLKKSNFKIIKPSFGKKMNRKEFNDVKDKLIAKGKKIVVEGQY